MTAVITVPVRFRTCRRRLEQPAASPRPAGPSAIARRIALAHQIEAWVRDGAVLDYADAARRLRLTRARISQIVTLTWLAPAVQEFVLLGHAVPSDRQLREVETHPLWTDQLRAFREMFPDLPMETEP